MSTKYQKKKTVIAIADSSTSADSVKDSKEELPSSVLPPHLALPKPPASSYNIYEIQLEDGYWYIGRTGKALADRISTHYRKEGAVWTKLHPVVCVTKAIVGNKYQEDIFFFEAVENYGIDRIRGGTWCNVVLSPEDNRLINARIFSANFATKPKPIYSRCGRSNHTDAGKCYAKTHVDGTLLEKKEASTVEVKEEDTSCTRCGRSHTDAGKCYAKTHVDGKVLSTIGKEEDTSCTRCGRSNHTDASKCYAKTHMDGRELPCGKCGGIGHSSRYCPK